MVQMAVTTFINREFAAITPLADRAGSERLLARIERQFISARQVCSIYIFHDNLTVLYPCLNEKPLGKSVLPIYLSMYCRQKRSKTALVQPKPVWLG